MYKSRFVFPIMMLLGVHLVAGSSLRDAALGQEKAKDPKADSAKQVRDKLQGVWVFAQITDCGKNVPDEERALMSLEFKGDKFTLVTIRAPKENPIPGSYSVDPGKSPARMDLTFTIEDGSTKAHPAIYRLKDAKLELCFSARTGEPRPEKFEATTKTVLPVLKKKNP